jgi:hypothetical protein
MKPLVLALLCLSARAALPDAEAVKLVDAIYLLEGGAKTRWPYGIKSVKVEGEQGARRVCFRTVQNTHTRWIAAGRPGKFTDFLADRYCPPSADPVGNRNWKINITALTSSHEPAISAPPKPRPGFRAAPTSRHSRAQRRSRPRF